MTIPTVRAFYFKQKYNIQMPVNIHNMEHIIIYKPFDFITIDWPYNKCQFHSSERTIHNILRKTNKSFFLTITLMNIRNAALEKERCIIIRSLYLLADYPKNMSFCQSILCLIVYLILAIENVKVFGIANLLLRSKSAPFDTFFKATFFIVFVSYNFLRNWVTNTSKCI